MQSELPTRSQDIQPRPRRRRHDDRALAEIERFAVSEVAPELAEPGLLHAIFEERARESPERVAVVCGDVSVTYGELDRRADAIATALRARGVGPRVFVAFQLPRSIEVYAVLLGILKSGAAYVPLDPEFPPDRVETILRDCGAAAWITAAPLGGVEVTYRADTAAVEDRPATSNDVAYVIYTSGSTGSPKGVAVEHASVVHLVRAEQRLFRITPSDRVLQGFSIAFDAAVEEIWLAFAAGATLVVAPKEALVGHLAELVAATGVTVLSTVPTLLATLQADLPTVRLLIVGGEACPQPVADRFAAGRAMYNTYGPTEATVIATAARLRPGEKVTLGRPIPNYRIDVVDDQGRLAPPGAAGEIWIGGPGIARGYVGNEALTSSKFVRDPRGRGGRFYRTGDRGRFDAHGNIEFLGRVDDQVKLRGYRIELGEIEAALVAAGAAQAVAIVRDADLVGYVVAREGSPLSAAALKAALRATLPPYMIPAYVEVLEAMPTLTSGKVDKRRLPPPSPPSTPSIEADPRGPTETAIADAFRHALGLAYVGRDADFFTDLGGHSLLVARVVSRLRRVPSLAKASVLDVYTHRTIAGLAKHFGGAIDAERRANARPRVSSRARPLCMAAQLVSLYPIIAVHAAQWLGPYLAYALARRADVSLGAAVLAATAVVVAVQPLALALAVVAKWAVIGRYKPGRYPLWGAYFFRFWLVERLLAIAPLDALVGTPLLPMVLRLLGARVGANAHLATSSVRCFDLVTIGDDVAVGEGARVRGYAVENGELVIGPIRIGNGAVVRARSVVGDDVVIGDGAALGDLSHAPRGSRIGRGERWAGSPARRDGKAVETPIVRPTAKRRAVNAVAYAVGSMSVSAIALAALLPGFLLLGALAARVGGLYILAAPVAAALFAISLCLEIAVLKRIALGRVRPGTYPLHGGFAFRRWLFERAMAVSLDVLGGLYATLYLNPWYRLLGVRLGPGAEVSTASAITPDLLSVGEDAFVADCVSLGAPRVGRGVMVLEKTRIGPRAFVGNSALVPTGAVIERDCLVGCLSAAPGGRTPPETSWLGSPPVALLVRQATTAFPIEATYRPSRTRVAQRLAIEAIRVTLPTTCFIVLTCTMIEAVTWLSSVASPGFAVASFPALYAAFGAVACAWVVVLKWILVGRYAAGEKPLFSTFVWRSELVTAMHENLADPFLNQLFAGTALAPWFFRALGASIGRRVYMATTQLTEYDLVSVGDEACLDEDCTLQTHLFEDRVMKMSTVDIGARASVGVDAIVLYDTRTEEGARVGPLTLVMKGERLPAETEWEGSPALAAEDPVRRPNARGRR